MAKEKTAPASASHPSEQGSNFIRAIVEADLAAGKHNGKITTRFPPEPNGYPHIGHAKAICLNFGLAHDFKGSCNLRFDDTNPETEDIEYVNAIKRDIQWLGFEWDDREYYASDYFEQLYDWAVELIRKGKAYVDDLSEEEIRAYRGTVTEPGRESPYRNRSVEENLDLLERMRKGEFENGRRVLRAKIDMTHPNMKMRDPLMYRIRHAHHYRRGDDWCLYPFYDWAHGQSDAIEGITHSICTLEFDNNRELYDWFLDNLEIDPRPHQYEMARLNLDYTIMSKRKLLKLVEGNHVNGWDDPRMPTLSGMRRRGITPEAIRTFCDTIGVAKADSRVDIGLLEHCIRNDLNYKAPRVMAVLNPLKVVLLNYPEDKTEHLEAPYYPHDVPKEGARNVPFSRELYIERDDFREDPPRRFHRLAPGREVRLRYAYIIRCVDVVKDDAGNITELHCTYDPDTRSGSSSGSRRVKGTLHWVSAAHARPAEVRLYDRLFHVANPDDTEEGQTFIDHLNPDSLVILRNSFIEPSVADDPPDTRYQFERQGYFYPDPVDHTPDAPVFNRIVPLRDSWAKIAKTAKPPKPKKKPAPSQRSDTATPKSRTPDRPPKPTMSLERSARVARYTNTLGLTEEDALLLTDQAAVTALFEEAVAHHPNAKSIANWIIHELAAHLKDRAVHDLPFGGAQVASLVALIDDHTLSSTLAKNVLAEMVRTGKDPRTIVDEQGLQKVSDPNQLVPVIEKILTAHPDKVEQYRSGKTGLIGFFVGQIMRATGGKADPKLVQQLLREAL